MCVSSIILLVAKYCISFKFSTLLKFLFQYLFVHWMDYLFLLQLQWIVIRTISDRNVRVNQSNFSPPFTYLACMAGSPPVCTCQFWRRRQQHKVDLSRRVIRLSGNSTLSGRSVTSHGAGGSPAEAIIRLLFGDVCDRGGPFLKFEKNRHMASRKPRFGFGSVSP